MSETDRWNWPLLEAGQAQKEMTHNEALAAIDLLVQATVVAVGVDAPPTDPAAGQCWIVGEVPTAAWAGRAGALAGWTGGGWRFVAPREGQAAWSLADGCAATFTGGQWRIGRVAGTALVIGGKAVVGAQRPAIALPDGGSTVDSQARAVLGQVVAVMTAHGLIAG